MKTAFSILFLFVALVCYGQMPFITGMMAQKAAPSAAATYLINQNFEGTGYDNSETWTEIGTGCNEDSTDVVLRGSQSLKIASAGSDTYTTSPAFTAQNTVHVACRFRYTGTIGQIHQVLNGYLNTTLAWRIQTDTTAHLVIRHNTTQSGASATALSTDTTYFLWIDYTLGGGADGAMALYISTTRTKPESAELTIANGNGTSQTDRIRLMGDYNTEDITEWFDQILVDDETIGDLAE